MVPSMDVQNIGSKYQNAGFGIDSMHNFIPWCRYYYKLASFIKL